MSTEVHQEGTSQEDCPQEEEGCQEEDRPQEEEDHQEEQEIGILLVITVTAKPLWRFCVVMEWSIRFRFKYILMNIGSYLFGIEVS